MFRFMFSYEGDESSTLILPLAPSSFKTKVGNKNKTIELVSLGEVNLIKSIGLREFSFKILLPKNADISGQNETEFKPPIFYLSQFREMKASAKPIRFKIVRMMPDGSVSFPGDVPVSIEDYTVEENAGEEGDYWVELKLKEYRFVEAVVTSLTGNTTDDGKAEVSQEIQRETKDTAETYTVQSGDSLWKIAKLQLNDGSRYKEIAALNNISDPNRIQVGTVLKLP